jgi:ribose transport system ATP-binding protein
MRGSELGREAGASPRMAVLDLRHLSKTFDGTRVLRDASLTVEPGEIHGLVGQNGSGKSTLIKILAGFHSPDPGGELIVNGKAINFPLRPGQFRQIGLSFVHQELALITNLSAVENFRIDDLSTKNRWRINWRDERRRASEVFAQYGVPIDPAEPVADLSPTNRALLAIIRAVEEARVARPEDHYGLLILDEPTVSLPASGKQLLFDLVRDIARRHTSVLFVSHDLDEVLEITERVTVLRDGEVQGTVTSSGVTKQHLVEMIVGRRFVAPTVARRAVDERPAAIQVRELSGSLLHGVSFDLRPGEVLGLTGLGGTGFEEVPYLLFGARGAGTGSLTLAGREFDLTRISPVDAIAAGVVLVPADRKRDGSEGTLSIADNVLLPVVASYFRRGRLNRALMQRDAQGLLTRFTVRPNRPELPYQVLSGGNQQKALLAKWLQTRPKLLLLHEPTQGVDIGARQDIFRLIRDAVREGTAVICASTEYEQIATICDRVLVFGRESRTVELTGDQITKDRIAEQCYALMGDPLSSAKGLRE